MILVMLNQRWMFKSAKYKNLGKICIARKNFAKFLHFALLNIHRWFNITNIIPRSLADGSLELKTVKTAKTVKSAKYKNLGKICITRKSWPLYKFSLGFYILHFYTSIVDLTSPISSVIDLMMVPYKLKRFSIASQ